MVTPQSAPVIAKIDPAIHRPGRTADFRKDMPQREDVQSGSSRDRSEPLADLVTPALTTAAERLAAVRREIAAACREARRDPASVTLVAISKTFAAEAIEPVIAAGQRVFGENRVQEAKAKWPGLQERHPARGLRRRQDDR